MVVQQLKRRLEASPRRCLSCGGNVLVQQDRRGGRWWREMKCLQCGREVAERPTPERMNEEQRLEDKKLRIPSDMRGWKALLERPAAGNTEPE